VSAPSHARLDMLNQFPITVHTSGSDYLNVIMIFPIPPTHRLESSSSNGVMMVLKICVVDSSSHPEVALQVYSAVGTCIVMFHSCCIRRYRNYSAILISNKSIPTPSRCPCPFACPCACLCPCPCPWPCPCACPCACLCPCPCPWCFEFYVQRGNYFVNSQRS
jgi:hypothetical protein